MLSDYERGRIAGVDNLISYIEARLEHTLQDNSSLYDNLMDITDLLHDLRKMNSNKIHDMTIYFNDEGQMEEKILTMLSKIYANHDPDTTHYNVGLMIDTLTDQ